MAELKIRTARQVARFAVGTLVRPLDGQVAGGAPRYARVDGDTVPAWEFRGVANGHLRLEGMTADAVFVPMDDSRFSIIGR